MKRVTKVEDVNIIYDVNIKYAMRYYILQLFTKRIRLEEARDVDIVSAKRVVCLSELIYQ